jgi:hypothetical protein
MARQLAAPGDDDCALKDSACPDCKASSCADFYEYNAKVQLTSWAGGCTQPKTRFEVSVMHGVARYSRRLWFS